MVTYGHQIYRFFDNSYQITITNHYPTHPSLYHDVKLVWIIWFDFPPKSFLTLFTQNRSNRPHYWLAWDPTKVSNPPQQSLNLNFSRYSVWKSNKANEKKINEELEEANQDLKVLRNSRLKELYAKEMKQYQDELADMGLAIAYIGNDE